MIKVFIPVNKGKIKTDVRGFWRNDNGKVFYDYIRIKEFAEYPSYKVIEALRIKYNQEALAVAGDSLNLFYANRQEVLDNQKVYCKIGFKGLKDLIKKLLTDYNGVTIYKETEGVYKLEVFYK